MPLHLRAFLPCSVFQHLIANWAKLLCNGRWTSLVPVFTGASGKALTCLKTPLDKKELHDDGAKQPEAGDIRH